MNLDSHFIGHELLTTNRAQAYMYILKLKNFEKTGKITIKDKAKTHDSYITLLVNCT